MSEILPVQTSQLTEAAVLRRLEVNKAILNSVSDSIETDYGFIHDVVLRLQSILGESQARAMINMSDLVNPLTAGQVTSGDQSVINATAASFGLTRFSAVPAAGTVTFVVSTNRTTVIPGGTILSTSGGQLITVQNTYVAQPSSVELRGIYDRRLTANANGNYEFTVPAVTVSSGATIRIEAGESLSLQSESVSFIAEIKTASVFAGGQDEESDAELISRIRSIFPAKSLSTRQSISSFLRQPDVLPTLQATSTIGFGDDEMRRGNGLYATADIYARTQSLPIQQTVVKTATVSGDAPGVEATWTISIGRDDAPGFYRVVSATFDNGAFVKQITMTRGYDISDLTTELIPRIASAEDAAFSRFQTATLSVTTSNDSYSLGDTTDVSLVVEYMPSLSLLQTAVSDRKFRFVGGDSLVRAPVPVYVSLTVDVVTTVDSVTYDLQTIRSSVASLFNAAGFAETIYATQVSTLVNSQLPSGASVRDVSGLASVVYPDGTIKRFRFGQKFELPPDAINGVTSRTASWFVSSNNVSININNTSQPLIV